MTPLLLFDPFDPADIAAAVRRIWTDDRLRSELATRGLLRVERLSWQATARRFRALYRSVAGVLLDEDDEALLAEEPAL